VHMPKQINPKQIFSLITGGSGPWGAWSILILVGSHAEGSHCWALISSLALLAGIVDRGQGGHCFELDAGGMEAWKKERLWELEALPLNGHTLS
jgi:hypothetical protein